jgi:hypothetical protein
MQQQQVRVHHRRQRRTPHPQARNGADLSIVSEEEAGSAREIALESGHQDVAAFVARIEAAGGYASYITELRLQYCRIRRRVGENMLVLGPKDPLPLREVCHFMFGRAEATSSTPGKRRSRRLRGDVPKVTAPDDIFARIVGEFLVER